MVNSQESMQYVLRERGSLVGKIVEKGTVGSEPGMKE